MHDVVDVHDTPYRRPSGPKGPGGVGVGWIFQVVPVQRSASVVAPLALPTAVHALAEVHDTPDSTAFVAPDGFGVVWTVHFVPFQSSAKGVSAPGKSLKDPTAVHVVNDTHETASKTFASPIPRSGL